MIKFGKNGIDFSCLADSVSVETISAPICTHQLKEVPQMSSNEQIGQKMIALAAAGVLITQALGILSPAAASAQSPGEDLGQAFEPVKELLIDLADPLCYVMFVWGCIECIVGRPASGVDRMKYAAIGFIAINWIPVIMNVIRGAAPQHT